MRKLYYTEEVFTSWKICMEKGVLHNAKEARVRIEPGSLVEKQSKNSRLISVFEHNIELIKDLIPGWTAFSLVDDCGILIKKNKHK